MGTRLTITPPADYVLARDVASYGYFVLAPNAWDARRGVLARPFHLADGLAAASIAQPGAGPRDADAWSTTWRGAGSALRVQVDRALTRVECAGLRAGIRRMLHLDDEGVADFHRLDPRWRRSGRARIFRSPTLFEDVLKTVTSCNVTWSGTKQMNRRLCAAYSPAFPRPADLARRRPETLRRLTGVGYRDARIIELARLFQGGEIDENRWIDPAVDDATVRAELLDLPGVGPYAAHNIMQLLGRYAFLAVDTETMRHARNELRCEGDDSSLRRQVEAYYEPFGRQRFRSYWFELWTAYERDHGPAWAWTGAERLNATGGKQKARG